jgi:Plasmid encoded RepA protein
VQQKSPTVRFRSGAEMLETFGLQKGGKEYRRLVAAYERIFGATIFFGTDTISGKAKLVERSRFHFLREARIWYHRRPEQTVLSSEFENVIVLSDEFYEEIMEHPIPTDLEAVKVLAGARSVSITVLSLFSGEGRGSHSAVWRFWLSAATRLCGIFASAPFSRQAAAVAGQHSRPLAGVPGSADS